MDLINQLCDMINNGSEICWAVKSDSPQTGVVGFQHSGYTGYVRVAIMTILIGRMDKE